ncbi:MAG: hypothetical protein ABSH20_16960 [Tepidisphaeraceae bacterium]|jgi:hypothetical protein
MSTAQFAKRLAALEAEMAALRQQLGGQPAPVVPWWEKIAGKFAGDPAYDEAMRLGREYRESLRPKPAKRKRRNGHSGH